MKRETGQRHCWFAAFFAFGAAMCGLTIGLLLFPGSIFDSLWRLNPAANSVFHSMGSWAVALMAVMGTACALTAAGLLRGSRWGIRLALLILSLNILGDLINVITRHDYRALIGVPIAGAMIVYLQRSENR